MEGVMPQGLHVATAGQFCVPTAIEIITGCDPLSVVFPALNRHARRDSLLQECAGEFMTTAKSVLEELGYHVRRYKGDSLNSLVSTWAKRFPDHTVLVASGGKGEGHCMVLRGGKIYDSWFPLGIRGDGHAYSNTKVTWAALVQRKE